MTQQKFVHAKLRGLDDVADLLDQIAPRQAINIMRTTINDMAKEVSEDAKRMMPSDEGDMEDGTKHFRQKGSKRKVRSTVRVASAFYWRFLEYGDGPDGVEHAFFLNAHQKMKSTMEAKFLRTFVKKFEAALNRARKRLNG